MKIRYPFLLLVFCFNAAWADFSNSKVDYHPLNVVANEPFIIEVSGDWPTDCHPGEQKPVISAYTGDSVLIEFETIVLHVTCNDVETPYRVLVDMSDVIGSVAGDFPNIGVTIRFDDHELTTNAPNLCPGLCPPPLPTRDIKPEAGLYFSNDLDKQGLLLARQNQRMAAYPLIYDESGSSEWVFGGGGIVEDAFFTELNELTGGQCLGCPAPAEPPQLGVVGKLTMLMDSEGVIQVKVGDGQFVSYEQLDFGYGRISTGAMVPGSVANLSGRWAFVEDVVVSPLLAPSGSNMSLIPLVFDVTALPYPQFESDEAPPEAPNETPGLPNYVLFSVADKAGDEVAQMRCPTVFDASPQDEMVCDLFNQEMNNGGTIYEVRMSSLERLSFDYVGPILSAAPTPAVIAVRID